MWKAHAGFYSLLTTSLNLYSFEAGVDGLMNAELPVTSQYDKRDDDAFASTVEVPSIVDVLKAT